MIKKYCVTVARIGCVFVKAASEAEAKDIANHQTTDTIIWSDDWEPTYVFEDDSALDGSYVSERAFD